MAAMEGVVTGDQSQQQQQQQQPVERLNPMVLQQLNLESVKTRAIGLFKAISRILEDLDVIGRNNAVPRWQDVLGQFSMVNLELYNIVEDIKKVSKAFIVFPKNVNAENATILPVMLSSKLLPEMEVEDNAKRDQVLHGIQNLPIPAQIEKLKTRIDMIGAACESAEKVLADTRKAYGFGARQGPTTTSTLDKAQAAKIQEQETLLRAAVNYGDALRIPMEQRQITSSLPLHLVDVLTVGDGMQGFSDISGMYQKNTPPMSNHINSQGTHLQPSGGQLMGRSVPSPSGANGAASFDNTSSPLPYTNSPRSGANIMNAPSPQQQAAQQQQMQQRQAFKQLPQHQQQQLLAQQQFRQSSMSGLGQNQVSQLHDMQGQQKFQTLHGQQQPMRFSQGIGNQQFQSRQMATGQLQHGIGQTQLNQGNQLNRQMNQFTGTANSALFNAAQSTSNPQMISNMSATMPSQSLVPRMQGQFGLSGTNSQRNQASQILNDQMYNIGGTNASNMMSVQQQQQLLQGTQGGYGTMQSNMQSNTQNLQSAGMGSLQNTQQNNHTNFPQQRQPNQQQ